jgi:SAM-dependent methyltransferase
MTTTTPIAGSGCAICGAQTAPQPRLRKNGYDIQRCPDCGVGRAIVPDFAPERFYTEGYFTGLQEGAYVDYVGAEAILRREFKRQCDYLCRFVPGGRLLEIGCAYGFFLQEAKYRFEVHGVEMVAAAVDHCHSAGLPTVRQGALTRDYLESSGPFDAIVMLDVIEHIDDVAGTMELALEFLNPGGVVLVTTGDWNSLFARLTGASWRLVAPPLHLWYFTTGSLQQMFGRFRCRLVDLSHPWKFVPLELVVDQAALMIGLRGLRLPRVLHRIGLPANLFDAMRLVFRKDRDVRQDPLGSWLNREAQWFGTGMHHAVLRPRPSTPLYPGPTETLSRPASRCQLANSSTLAGIS